MQKPEQKQQQQLQNKQNADANNFAALFICAMCVRLCVCLLFLCCLGSSSSIRRFSFSFYPRFVASNFQCCFRYWRSVILLRLQQQLFLLLLLLLLLFLFCHNERTVRAVTLFLIGIILCRRSSCTALLCFCVQLPGRRAEECFMYFARELVWVSVYVGCL